MSVGTEFAAERKRRWNWWKVAFFIALIAFELAREFAVIANDQAAQPNTSKSIFGNENYIAARGSWLRSDGGSPIIPGAVTIECRKETGQCVEASVSAGEVYFYAPELDWFDAKFTPEGVTYLNDNPDCARYTVRIDTVTDRAFATRDRKANPLNDMCVNMEKRVAMELGDGGPRKFDASGEHFVPLISALVGALDLFDRATSDPA